MAILLNADRVALWKDWMEMVCQRREPFGPVVKPYLRAAVDAIDAWVDANAASFNAAIPLPARTAMTPKQKVELFLAVVRRRYEVS